MKRQQQESNPVEELQILFEESPPIKYGDCLDIWKNAGPIIVQDWISSESIRINPELKTVID